jgi:hypothetical protein
MLPTRAKIVRDEFPQLLNPVAESVYAARRSSQAI